MGARLVPEVFLGLLTMDPASDLNLQPSWLPARRGDPRSFAMADLLTAAGVDPASRGQ